MDTQRAKQDAKRELEELGEEEKKFAVEVKHFILRVSSALKEDRLFDLENRDIMPKLKLASDRGEQILKSKEDLQRCPCCRGRGNHMGQKRERDEGVHEYLETRDCLTCKSTGKLGL